MAARIISSELHSTPNNNSYSTNDSTQVVTLDNAAIYTIERMARYNGTTKVVVHRQDSADTAKRRSTLKAYRAEAGR